MPGTLSALEVQRPRAPGGDSACGRVVVKSGHSENSDAVRSGFAAILSSHVRKDRGSGDSKGPWCVPYGSRTSMKALTEKTAWPGPGWP